MDQIKELVKDKEAMIVEGNLIKLDKEKGTGRFRPLGMRSAISFIIPKDFLDAYRERFIEALHSRKISVEAIAHRDGIGNVVRFSMLRVVGIG